MTEGEARDAVAAVVGTDAMQRLSDLVAMVVAENTRQNLIAASTVPTIWVRHIWDSVQLLRLMPLDAGSWIDVGTGGGFPGMAIACAVDVPITLIEPRRRRADFLTAAASALRLGRITVEPRKVERVAGTADVISARAVAPAENLLRAAMHCATPTTRWLLPRGRSAPDDVAALAGHWKGLFHVEQSLSDPEGAILVLDRVVPR